MRFHLLIILLICITIRLLFWYSHPGIGLFADSDSYYVVGKGMMESGQPVDDSRSPLYPLFLGAISYLTTGELAEIESPPFMIAMHWVVLIQSLTGIASLFLCWRIIRMVSLPHWVQEVVLLFVGTNISLFGAEHLILTETFSTALLLQLTLFTLLLWEKSTMRRWFFLGLSLCLAYLLKPVYVMLPFLIVPLIMYKHQTRHNRIAAACTLGFFLLILGYYQYKNMQLYRYPGISRTGDINLLGKILAFDLPIEAGASVPYFYESMTDYRKRQGPKMPFRFLETYNSEIYAAEEYRLNELPRFNRDVIMASLPSFLSQSLRLLPAALIEPNDTILTPALPSTPLGRFFQHLYEWNQRIQYLFLLVFLIYPASLYSLWKDGGRAMENLVIIGTIAWYQIIFSVFFSYGEFGRLLSPGIPLLYLCVIAGISIFTKKISMKTFPSR